MPNSLRDDNVFCSIYDEHYIVVSNARPYQLVVLALANSLSTGPNHLFRVDRVRCEE